MATQIGLLRIRGTISGICFYCLNGQYYARQKSSLTGKRVKKDPAFAETMRYAGLLGKAAKIASEKYKLVPKEERSRNKYRALVGMVMQELKMVKTVKESSAIHELVFTNEAQRYREDYSAAPARIGHRWTLINADKYGLRMARMLTNEKINHTLETGMMKRQEWTQRYGETQRLI